MDTLDADVRPACAEQLASSARNPSRSCARSSPRTSRAWISADSTCWTWTRTSANSRREQQSRDPGSCRTGRSSSRAQRRFSYFSDKLVEDLTLLDANRFELAGFLLEGFVETQEFTLQRHRDVMGAMSVGKLLQRTNRARADAATATRGSGKGIGGRNGGFSRTVVHTSHACVCVSVDARRACLVSLTRRAHPPPLVAPRDRGFASPLTPIFSRRSNALPSTSTSRP